MSPLHQPHVAEALMMELQAPSPPTPFSSPPAVLPSTQGSSEHSLRTTEVLCSPQPQENPGVGPAEPDPQARTMRAPIKRDEQLLGASEWAAGGVRWRGTRGEQAAAQHEVALSPDTPARCLAAQDAAVLVPEASGGTSKVRVWAWHSGPPSPGLPPPLGLALQPTHEPLSLKLALLPLPPGTPAQPGLLQVLHPEPFCPSPP